MGDKSQQPMQSQHHPAPLYIIAIILVTFTLVIASGTSIILIAIDFLSKANHFSSPARSTYSINIMMLFFLGALPGHFIGKIIQARNAIILASILSSIGLILLSLANLLELGTSIFIFGLSMAYISYLNVTFNLMQTRPQNFDVVMFAFLYCAVSGLILGVILQHAITHWLGDANTYLISGILTVFALLLFIFINHFFIPPEPNQTNENNLASYTCQTALISIASILVILWLYSSPTLTRYFTAGLFAVILANRFYKMHTHQKSLQHHLYFCVLIIAILFWSFSGIGNFLFNNIRAEKFWLYTFTQWYSLNTNNIAMKSAILNYSIGFLVPIYYWLNSKSKRPLSYFSSMAMSCFILGAGLITLWLPMLFNHHSNTNLPYLLPFHWIAIYELCYSFASTLFICNIYTIANRIFIKDTQKFAFVELTASAALVWLIIAFLSNLISWQVSQVSVNSWRAIYPGINGTLGLLLLCLGVAVLILNNKLKKRYGHLENFTHCFWRKAPAIGTT